MCGLEARKTSRRGKFCGMRARLFARPRLHIRKAARGAKRGGLAKAKESLCSGRQRLVLVVRSRTQYGKRCRVLTRLYRKHLTGITSRLA